MTATVPQTWVHLTDRERSHVIACLLLDDVDRGGVDTGQVAALARELLECTGDYSDHNTPEDLIMHRAGARRRFDDMAVRWMRDAPAGSFMAAAAETILKRKGQG